MQLDAILDLWRNDSQIGIELSQESLGIPKLHHKYYTIFVDERLSLRKIQAEFKVLERAKIDYYSGTIDINELNNRGWKPWSLKILKSDISGYVDSDKDIIEINLKIGYLKEKIDLLESILTNIHNRGFQIKNAIDFMRFQSGA